MGGELCSGSVVGVAAVNWRQRRFYGVTVKIEAEFFVGRESLWEDERGWAHYGTLVCACVVAEASECG